MFSLWQKISCNIVWLLVAMIFSSAETGLAQEKPKPRPTPTKVRDDSTETTRAKKRESEESQSDKLELPDVLIYGEETSSRLPGAKQSPKPDPISLQRLQEKRALDDSAAIELNPKEGVSAPRHQQRQLLGVRTHAGQFGQLGLGLGFWKTSKQSEATVDAEYFRREGEFDNSQIRRFDLDGQLGATLAKNLAGRGQLHIQSNDYGLYGASLDNYERDSDYFQLLAGGRVNAGSATDLSFEASFLSGDADDQAQIDSARFLRAKAEWRTFSMGVSAEHRFSKLETRVRFAYVNDDIRPSHGFRDKPSFTLLQVELSFPIRERANLALGLTHTSAKSDSAADGSRLAPFVKVVWVPANSFALSGEFSGGWNYAPFHERLRENPYLDLLNLFGPEERLWQIKLTGEYRITQQWVLKLNYLRERLNHLSYWERSDSTGLFVLNRLSGVTLSDLNLGMEFTPAANLTFVAAVHLLNDQLDDNNPNIAGVFELPYRSEFWMPVTVTYQPIPKVTITGEGRWVGSRRVRLSSTDKIGSYLDLGAQAEWQAHRIFSVFGGVRNLLDEDYEIWRGYPEIGFNVIAGMKANW